VISPTGTEKSGLLADAKRSIREFAVMDAAVSDIDMLISRDRSPRSASLHSDPMQRCQRRLCNEGLNT
jgi:hypothetical protein